MPDLNEMEVGLPNCPSCDHLTKRGMVDHTKHAHGEVPIMCANCGEVGVHLHGKLLNRMYSKDAIDLAKAK